MLLNNKVHYKNIFLQTLTDGIISRRNCLLNNIFIDKYDFHQQLSQISSEDLIQDG